MTFPAMFVSTTVHGRDRLVESARVQSGQRPPVRCRAHGSEPESAAVGPRQRAARTGRRVRRARQRACP